MSTTTVKIPYVGMLGTADKTTRLKQVAVNLLAEGIKGDGSDEASALNTILTQVATDGGGIVEAPTPPTNYAFASGVTVPANVHLVGRGKGVTFQSFVTSGASITLNNYSRLAHITLQGSRTVAPVTPIGVYAANGKHVLLENVAVAEYTDACVRFLNMIRSALWHCEINHAVNAGQTAIGLDLADGFNNGIVVLGGEIRGSSYGAHVGRGADAVTFLGTVIESNGTGAQWKSCDALRFQGVHFEANATRDFEGVADTNYDDPATNVVFDSCHFTNSPTLGIVRNTATIVFLNNNPTPKTQGAPSTRTITLADGTQNVVVIGRSPGVFRNENGALVRTDAAPHLQENALLHSAAFSNAAWTTNSAVSSVEDTASDSTTFLDGTAAMRVIVTGTCNKSIPARIYQTLTSQKGRLIGERVWVRMATGKTGTLYPYIAGTTAITGSEVVTGAPHRLDLTDQWREIPWTGVIPAADASTTHTLGWWFFPDDGTSATDFYFARPQSWYDSTEPPQYAETAGTAVARTVTGALSSTQVTDLTDGGTTTLHGHDESLITPVALYDAGNSSTAITLTYTAARPRQKVTLTGNATITLASIPAGGSLEVHVNTGAGSFTGTFAVTGMGTLRWFGGTAPTVTTTASKRDVYAFEFDGTDTLGFVLGQGA